MYAVHIDRAPLLQSPPPASRLARILLDPEFTGDSSLSVGVSIYAPGQAAPSHSHPTAEVMVVLEGNGVFTWPGGTLEAGPGMVLWCPAREEHSIDNRGSDTLKFLWVYAPAGGEEALKQAWTPVD